MLRHLVSGRKEWWCKHFSCSEITIKKIFFQLPDLQVGVPATMRPPPHQTGERPRRGTITAELHGAPICGPGANPQDKGRGGHARLVLRRKTAIVRPARSIARGVWGGRAAPPLKVVGTHGVLSLTLSARFIPSWSSEYPLRRRCSPRPPSPLVSKPNTSARGERPWPWPGGRHSQAETQEPRTGSDSVAVAAEDPAAAPGPGARSPYRCAQMQRAAATPAQTITGSGTA